MSEVKKILTEFGENVKRLSKINIGASQVVDGKRRRMDSTGRLRNSIRYELQVSKNETSFSFTFYMEDYGKFQDQGVKGANSTKPSARNSPFRYKQSSRLPIPYIKQWIKDKPVRIRDLKTGSFKAVKDKTKAVNSLAFIIAKSVKEHGLSATNFFTEPFTNEFAKLPDDLVEAFGLDIDNFLTN